MKSHKALAIAAGKDTKDSRIAEIAKRMVLSKFTVYKWTEPAEDPDDSGSRNILDLIEQFIETCRALGASQEDAEAPLQYLNERFGKICISLPDLPPCKKELSKELLEAIQDFSALAKTSSKALIDDDVNKREAADIDAKAWHLIRQVAMFTLACKQAAK